MGNLSPMMRQYMDIKEQFKSHILFFRLGDFYEMFFDDAITASDELDLTLTGRDCGQEERAPMCGVPYHSAEQYIARLIAKGYKIAVCEQLEDPASVKGIVRRDVVRVISPGTVIEANMLEQGRNNFFACVLLEREGAGLCFADISTGEIFATQLDGDSVGTAVLGEVGRFAPREALLCTRAMAFAPLTDFLKQRLDCSVEPVDFSVLSRPDDEIILNHFDVRELSQLGLSESPIAAKALALLLENLKRTQRNQLSHLKTLRFYKEAEFMQLDLNTRRNLELCETMRSKDKKGSLLSVIDFTNSAMGARLLRKWLEQPLTNVAAIRRRLGGVGELHSNTILLGELAGLLSGVYDLERLMSRVIYSTANGRDFRALAKTAGLADKIKAVIAGQKQPLLAEIHSSIDELKDLSELIERAITEEPPISIRDGGLIRPGYNEQVDELRAIMTGGRGIIAKIESDEREKSGIKNLKVGYNKVFGYYIEITKSNYEMVPERYIRKQTLANCERFITQELKDIETKILTAQDRITALEFELFNEIRERVAGQTHRIQTTASALARLDALSSLAVAALRNGYVMPEVDFGTALEIKNGRHPVVEASLENSRFVPNDTTLDCGENRTAIITGPNMAGKSTYMRQVALVVILAQMGSFVPAESAKIGVVDAVFTRVGASDDLSAGQSTFMVEMSEVAHILSHATSKSLIVFDEIGRGTSTFDGMSIARAVVEYVTNKKKLGAKTLFATHYHELTELEHSMDGVKNYNVVVKKRGDEITFLRKIVRGGADDSYGIEVAKIAGVPEEVIRRAKQVLEALETQSQSAAETKKTKRHSAGLETEEEGSLFAMEQNRALQKLRELDLSVMTPIEAMNALYNLQKEII